MNSISGGSTESALVTFMLVRYRRSDAALELRRLARFGAERLHDAVTGERLGATCEICSSASWLRRVVRRTRCPSLTSG